ncbi:ZIP family metal transporter [Patescibacteria group bacterium]|nr:ZIP family metal transporter [Patescibacteria group bacterium]MBU1500671.1 ZIP family metal transporter [Patescibacteria group bacterium]MBU2080376.1 ZIP family metal transporter [Patescibacteria group bacterium]MBU2124212.1 ZIP family metal transporter [Patescibacteria group bacterium]MBU2194337.1 ZIP family metal transporter [Patescibacteria group bacterium]
MTIQIISALLAVGVVSLVSLVGIVALAWKESVLRKILFLLVSVAAGALFGDAFIHLIPEAFEEAGNPLLVSSLILGGILTFFALEKFLRWHHSHGENELEAETHARVHPVGHLVLVSDGLHNFVDGVAIGAAFLISVEVGIATTIAIMLHEIPQEIGDFALLVHAGFSRTKALLVNFVSALLAFAGAGLAFWLADTFESASPLIAAFAAGSFVYIAGSDLVPELHKTTGAKRTLLQFVAILVGLGIMALLLVLE